MLTPFKVARSGSYTSAASPLKLAQPPEKCVILLASKQVEHTASGEIVVVERFVRI